MSVEQLAGLVGTTIDGKYEILRKLGQGGMGVVFHARHTYMDKEVAIKMLSAELAEDDQSFKRFQAEARAAAALNHPNIIKVTDLDMSSQGFPFIVMDYLEGRPLDAVLAKQRTLKWERAVPLFIKICDALRHAHSRRVVHRDLKPSNIMLAIDDDGLEYPVVVDFGLAKLYDVDGKGKGAKLTQTGQIFGTCLYMSPEQCQAQELDGRSDMYSMGCMMYEILTGTAPFMRANFMQTVMAHLNEEAVPIEQVVPGTVFPARLNDIVHKCMRRNINERYGSMDEVLEALQQVQSRGKERSKTMISTSAEGADRKSGASQADINFELGRNFEEKGDDEQAFVYYMRAAEKGHPAAQYLVGRGFFYGFGAERSLEGAIHWYRKAAREGVVNAMVELFRCLMYFDDPDAMAEAHAVITAAAQTGYAPAQHEVGHCFKFGTFGQKSAGEALAWYSKAAEQQYPPSLLALGNFYLRGEVVAQDEATAVQFFRAAAEQDYEPAAYQLYECYLDGAGVKQSMSSAIKWLDKAASAGYGPALLKFDYYYRYGKILEQDLERADQYRQEAFRRAHREDLYEHGMMLVDKGKRQDAVPYFEQAAEEGHEKAKIMLGR
ncbi:MAG: serine/threonine-protein kinase [Candidatus Obscuribacterales bacterium]